MSTNEQAHSGGGGILIVGLLLVGIVVGVMGAAGAAMDGLGSVPAAPAQAAEVAAPAQPVAPDVPAQVAGAALTWAVIQPLTEEQSVALDWRVGTNEWSCRKLFTSQHLSLTLEYYEFPDDANGYGRVFEIDGDELMKSYSLPKAAWPGLIAEGRYGLVQQWGTCSW